MGGRYARLVLLLTPFPRNQCFFSSFFAQSTTSSFRLRQKMRLLGVAQAGLRRVCRILEGMSLLLADVDWKLTFSLLHSCVLATLTVLGEVLLFVPNKDATKGEWSEVSDVTARLIAATIPEGTFPWFSPLRLPLTDRSHRPRDVRRTDAAHASGSSRVRSSLPDFRFVLFFPPCNRA
jgi:hypothetical protein